MSEGVHHHHQIDYIEFSVTEMKVAQEFYGNAFGWEFTDYAPAYSGINVGGREVGGLRLDTPKLGGPLVVLYSDDLDATARGVLRAGGTISIEPFDFPGGRRFHFLDPSGNELAVWGKPAD